MVTLAAQRAFPRSLRSILMPTPRVVEHRDPLAWGGSGLMVVPPWRRRRTPRWCSCRRECGGSNEPDPANALAVRLSGSGVARIGIQRVTIVGDLAAVGIGQQAQLARERPR